MLGTGLRATLLFSRGLSIALNEFLKYERKLEADVTILSPFVLLVVASCQIILKSTISA
jgi:hypothetical protein